MKVTGSMLSKAEEDKDNPPLSRHYVCCVLNVYSSSSTADGESTNPAKKIRRKYAQRNLGSVQRLSAGQVILGLMLIGCQLAPTYWQISIHHLNSNVWLNPAQPAYFVDEIMPGIWSGLFILVTGILGLVAAAKNSRCLITTHLVLNAFAVLFALTVAIMSGIGLAGLAGCKMTGANVDISQFEHYDGYNRWYATTTAPTTTIPNPVVFFGEVFRFEDGHYQNFYCTDGIFTIWMMMELAMTVSGLIALALTIALIVKNSKALSLCCRRCCTVEEEKEADADDASLLAA